MHARLALRLMSQRASHRFAVHRHMVFLLLPALVGQPARFVLTPLGRFPAREAPGSVASLLLLGSVCSSPLESSLSLAHVVHSARLAEMTRFFFPPDF